MKTLTPGHKYELANFENKEAPGQVLQFIEKKSELASITGQQVPNGGPPLVTVNDGTTNEEVLAMLIDRLQFLQRLLPSRETAIAVTHIETALLWLKARTKDRIDRGVEGKHAL